MTAAAHHPRHALDEVLQSPVRLSIVAVLDGVDKADFKTVRTTVEDSDSVLSKQLTVLEEAGYVEIGKARAGRFTRTWVNLTPAGGEALRAHLAALRAIAGVRLPDAGSDAVADAPG